MLEVLLKGRISHQGVSLCDYQPAILWVFLRQLNPQECADEGLAGAIASLIDANIQLCVLADPQEVTLCWEEAIDGLGRVQSTNTNKGSKALYDKVLA